MKILEIISFTRYSIILSCILIISLFFIPGSWPFIVLLLIAFLWIFEAKRCLTEEKKELERQKQEQEGIKAIQREEKKLKGKIDSLFHQYEDSLFHTFDAYKAEIPGIDKYLTIEERHIIHARPILQNKKKEVYLLLRRELRRSWQPELREGLLKDTQRLVKNLSKDLEHMIQAFVESTNIDLKNNMTLISTMTRYFNDTPELKFQFKKNRKKGIAIHRRVESFIYPLLDK